MVQCPIPPMRLTARNAPREHYLEDIAYNYSQLSANGLAEADSSTEGHCFQLTFLPHPPPPQSNSVFTHSYKHTLFRKRTQTLLKIKNWIFLSIYALS